MKRILFFLYGVVCYLIFLGTFLYAIGFVGNFFVPKGMDTGDAVPFGEALLMNVLLLGIFAIQHSVMARQGFKKWWTRIVPQPIERSTYVLLASLALLLLFWQWKPMGDVLWDVSGSTLGNVLIGVSLVGWLIVLASTALIDHFHLFGVSQVYSYLTNKEVMELQFAAPAFYKLVRHPLYLGFIIAFWATPVMTAAHLVFAIVTTAYILLAIQFEERDLVSFYGDQYRDYRRRVSMLIPLPPKK
ncbi:MAG: isoprenylcysteine carboxylmethyltransferase family protein [Acidobacteria bacterium]|nr:isoprenylcysteine carboxylmethyltransferase family protein [Acidobacteriota bacterium]